MPSEKVLEAKKAVVAEVAEKLKSSVAGVVVDYKGISVADDTKLRKDLREAGVDYFVIKNSLLGRALDDAGFAEMKDVLSGSTAIALSKEDYTAAARILCGYAKDHENFTIKNGFADGSVLGVDGVNTLATLPSKEGLLSMLLSVLVAPMRNLAYAVKAVSEKVGEGAVAEAAAPADEAAPAAEEAAPVVDAAAEEAAPAAEEPAAE